MSDRAIVIQIRDAVEEMYDQASREENSYHKFSMNCGYTDAAKVQREFLRGVAFALYKVVNEVHRLSETLSEEVATKK